MNKLIRQFLSVWFGTLFGGIIASGSPVFAADPIKVGVSVALTGDASAFGIDIKNALTLMNDKFGEGRYELIFEDERCDNREAMAAANKLIAIDHVRYALGFPCNSTLLAVAPVYDRAGVLVISSSATSGDVLDVGENIFRLFPSDVGGGEELLRYIAPRHQQIAFFAEQSEYPVMVERAFRRANAANGNTLKITTYDYLHGQTDFRSLLTKIRAQKSEAIVIVANNDPSYIDLVKQIRTSKFAGPIYSLYQPASEMVLKQLGPLAEGLICANLPLTDNLVTDKGRELMMEFRKRFGEPQSGFPVVPTTLEAFRVFDSALRSGQNPKTYLHSKKFNDGFIPEYYFDQHGAVQGIRFEMQQVVNGKMQVIK